MKHSIHPIAEVEHQEAFDYLEHESPGKGLQFNEEVDRLIDSICDFPFAGTKIEDGIRMRVVRRFPYKILYAIEPTGIYILTIMHCHREPDF